MLFYTDGKCPIHSLKINQFHLLAENYSPIPKISSLTSNRRHNGVRLDSLVARGKRQIQCAPCGRISWDLGGRQHQRAPGDQNRWRSVTLHRPSFSFAASSPGYRAKSIGDRVRILIDKDGVKG